MELITASLADQHTELAGLLVGLDAEGWQRETRCPGWSVADVVLHLTQTDELALASVRGKLPEALDAAGWDFGIGDIDTVAGAAVDRERGADPTALLARWTAASSALVEALRQCDPRERLLWVVGDLPARTFATTRLAEAWVHSGDVASGLGTKLVPADRLFHIARLAWRTLPYALKKAGQTLVAGVTLELTAPDGSVWVFSEENGRSLTTIRGSAEVFCEVAARRLPGDQSGLEAYGPDRYAVLDLVRTFA